MGEWAVGMDGYAKGVSGVSEFVWGTCGICGVGEG